MTLNFLNTHIYQIIAQRDVVHGCWPLINSSKGNRAGRILTTYNPHLFDAVMSRSYPEGSIQLPFILTQAPKGATSGSIEGRIPWDCILLKDNISYLITFSMIDCSSSKIFCVNSFLIFCLSQSSSFGLIGRCARACWSWSKVFPNCHTGSSGMDMARVLWLPNGNS